MTWTRTDIRAPYFRQSINRNLFLAFKNGDDHTPFPPLADSGKQFVIYFEPSSPTLRGIPEPFRER